MYSVTHRYGIKKVAKTVARKRLSGVGTTAGNPGHYGRESQDVSTAPSSHYFELKLSYCLESGQQLRGLSPLRLISGPAWSVLLDSWNRDGSISSPNPLLVVFVRIDDFCSQV
ncbi:hypothetical protein CDAR_105241 [Caerostris darwini]|uniref:Uncharacterized protein n=1 Tax=Caerostris darwini TaxID=1538125 RepID=A0AAV4V6R9_9ARAC|nr:hypothetical protein CDAR_105241 [Caerostris darwini]